MHFRVSRVIRPSTYRDEKPSHYTHRLNDSEFIFLVVNAFFPDERFSVFFIGVEESQHLTSASQLPYQAEEVALQT